MTRLVGAAFVPADGVYDVKIDSPAAAQRIMPTLTFGQSPLGAIGQRFEDAVDAITGPVGILVLLAIAAYFLWPRLRGAMRARRS